MKFPYWLYVSNKPQYAADSKFFRIRVKPEYTEDVGLIEHEKVHVKHWYYGLLFCVPIWVTLFILNFPNTAFIVLCLSTTLKGLLYTLVPSIRLWMEVEAYKVQIKHTENPNIEFFAEALATGYDLSISKEKALQKLKD